jgi:3',5'-cyclic AMP phosphodiesterase CpdA
MSKIYLIHVTDTHFALPADDIQIRLTGRKRAPGVRGAFVKKIQTGVVGQDGARPAEAKLWLTLNDELRSLVAALRTDATCELHVVHSGDITQAGQPKSLDHAMQALTLACDGIPISTVAGNHDVWPREFPLFAPERTALQGRFVRTSTWLPPTYPVQVSVGTPGLLDLVLLDSPVPDSAMNTTALGAVDAELLADGSFVRETDQIAAKHPRLYGAVLHHPPADVSTSISWWRSLQQLLNLSVGMVLTDAVRLRRAMLARNVAFAICGHEHAPPNAAADAICEQGRLLVLQGGCPTLFRNSGNADDPQFAVYEIEFERGLVQLRWYIRYLTPTPRWHSFGSYSWDGKHWAQGSPHSIPYLFPGRRKAQPLYP